MDISIIKPELANDIYDNMLLQFPKEELKSREKFLSLVERDDYFSYEITDNEKRIGYLNALLADNFIWVDYLAIYKEFHSCGYGSKVLELMKRKFANLNGCILEVEKVNPMDINTLRRVNFYKKQGAKLLECAYLYPNNNFALEMDLYYIPYTLKMPDKNMLKKVVRDVFNVIHDDISHIDEVYSKIVF